MACGKLADHGPPNIARGALLREQVAAPLLLQRNNYPGGDAHLQQRNVTIRIPRIIAPHKQSGTTSHSLPELAGARARPGAGFTFEMLR